MKQGKLLRSGNKAWLSLGLREKITAVLAAADPLPMGHLSLGSCTSVALGSNLTVLHPLGVFLLQGGLAAPLLPVVLAT